MHLHLVRVATRPTQAVARPAKVVALDSRRKARLERLASASGSDHALPRKPRATPRAACMREQAPSPSCHQGTTEPQPHGLESAVRVAAPASTT